MSADRSSGGRARSARSKASPCELTRLGSATPTLLIGAVVGDRAHRLRPCLPITGSDAMIRKLADGRYRLYSRKKDPKTGKRRNLGTFDTREAAQKHERAVQYFKRK